MTLKFCVLLMYFQYKRDMIFLGLKTPEDSVAQVSLQQKS